MDMVVEVDLAADMALIILVTGRIGVHLGEGRLPGLVMIRHDLEIRPVSQVRHADE